MKSRAIRRGRQQYPGKAALTGLVAGLVGAWAMNAFSAGWEKLLPASAGRPRIESAETRRFYAPMHASQQEWDTAMKTAATVAHKVLHWPLSPVQQQRGAVAAHYAIGATAGAAYAVAREYVPEIGRGAGAPFGAAVFLLAQEAGAPRLGLSQPFSSYSPAMQANALGEHVVWGITTELVRRLARRLL